MFFSSNNDSADLRRELHAMRVEQAAQRAMLETIMEELGVTHIVVSQDATAQAYGITPEVADALDAGRKIEAIKLYRAATGAGLKDAKDAVEDFERARGH